MIRILTVFFVTVLISACRQGDTSYDVTTATLIKELVDLERLVHYPSPGYKTIQFSSFDRRSNNPSEKEWFANEDGFGNEPIPGFLKVLVPPDSTGTGKYLVCDVNSPGAIVRLWTAGIKGRISLYLDNQTSPIYEGDAEYFFRNLPDALKGKYSSQKVAPQFLQYDAMYFPIPFAKKCRIEWTGKLSDLHFYHINIRVYNPDVNVRTFSPSDIEECRQLTSFISRIWKSPQSVIPEDSSGKNFSVQLSPSESCTLIEDKGEKAIVNFMVKVKSADLSKALRRTVLSIWFDDSQYPQVQAPIGDFFGGGPGVNLLTSLPFSVCADSSMICRYIMPFHHKMRMQVQSFSDQPVSISGNVITKRFTWIPGKTMHFYARWKTDHSMVASNVNPVDLPFLSLKGKGRLIGTACFIYNPCNIPTSWGNWWGEGDEKIWIDRDTFPSVFGTGTEDYFNYSWSSSRIFSFPFCGQPRCDGPGNRGFVSNFRWHIADDILFSERIHFNMEMLHHSIVPNFSYGRIIYYYLLTLDHDDFTPPDSIQYSIPGSVEWKPAAYLGSDGYSFFQAEKMLVNKKTDTYLKKGPMWAENQVLVWRPSKKNEILNLVLPNLPPTKKISIGMTLTKCPVSTSFKVYLNREELTLNGSKIIDLYEPWNTMLENFFFNPVFIKANSNVLTFVPDHIKPGKEIAIDFIWIKPLK
ncbi:MAG TPA: DUF2961 domain-containing protein [Bacteroidales bacterium]|nr:DUF2961 domain-containing protein [Bacteroidales bacterium]